MDLFSWALEESSPRKVNNILWCTQHHHLTCTNLIWRRSFFSIFCPEAFFNLTFFLFQTFFSWPMWPIELFSRMTQTTGQELKVNLWHVWNVAMKMKYQNWADTSLRLLLPKSFIRGPSQVRTCYKNNSKLHRHTSPEVCIVIASVTKCWNKQ